MPMLQKYTSVPVSHVIDPVGLLDMKEFEAIAVKPEINEPYAVMYLADSGDILNQAIHLLSKRMGLKIVHICGFMKKCSCDYFVKDAGPDEILGYILHADFVLSASFHATMFSLLFQKQFATLLPGEKTNARINDLLHYVGLENRISIRRKNWIEFTSLLTIPMRKKEYRNFSKESKAALLDTLSELTGE